MSHEGARPPRREFLGQLSLIALAASAPSSVAPVRELAAGRSASPWDLSWVERVAAAPYKVTLDANNINDGAALDYAADIMNTFRDVYGGPDTQTRVVVVMRQLGVPMALQDALWDKYVEQVQAEFRAELVPGAIVMPNGIFSLVRAQNAGCAYLKF